MTPPSHADTYALTQRAESPLKLVFHPRLRDIPPQAWQLLAGDHPFLSYELLCAFEDSGAVGEGTGWQPCHLAVYVEANQSNALKLDANSDVLDLRLSRIDLSHHDLSGESLLLLAAMPLYVKWHSYGEYVFDWAWADALERAGHAYYPKLISAIPFSPVPGQRLLMHPQLKDKAAVANRMLQALQQHAQQSGYSGIHLLFPDAESSRYCEAAGWLPRQGVQFRWENPGYANWEEFLSQLSHDKRKKIRQERQKVSRSGVVCQHYDGESASSQHWDFFYQCYVNTYHQHGSQPYLPKAFFMQLAQQLPKQLALFVAYDAERPVAASLCIHNQHTMYGRYWGAVADISCLHFELCYYQPQAFCISRGIRVFEGGAQGVHKLARGFTPTETHSWHWLQHPGLQQAVANFLNREQQVMAHTMDELQERSPFRRDSI